jgi:myo-inositol-1(or 4)-monophosphatase
MNSINATHQHFCDVAIAAARGASHHLVDQWEKEYAIREKSSPSDLLTAVDEASEKHIIAHIKAHFPLHGIIAEESIAQAVDHLEYVWVIDPLDGTTNYTHRFPMVCISIALLHRGQPIVAVVYNPLAQELFHAIKGHGAYLNDQVLKVSTVQDLSHSLLATGFAYDRRDTPNNNYAQFFFLTHISQGVRRMGSAALDLAFTAAGRLDGYWERGLKCWDVAAGILLVTEAGGTVSAYEGGPIDIYAGEVLATNGVIHKDLSHALLSDTHRVTIT